MSRKFFPPVATTALACCLVVGGWVTPAAAGPPHAIGSVLCGISTGSGALTPGLTPSGTPNQAKDKITFKGTFSTGNCSSTITSPAGVVVTGGTFSGVGDYLHPSAATSANSCANFDGPDVVGKIVVKIDWNTTGGPIASTKVVYQNNTTTVSGSSTDTIDLSAATGTAVKHGSFSSAPLPVQIQLQTTIPSPPCGPGPFSAFTISGLSASM